MLRSVLFPAFAAAALLLSANASAADPEPPGESFVGHPALLSPALATETAPEVYKVRFDTTKGPFVVEVHREWAPKGADRFYNLVRIGFFDDTAFFRAIDGFMVQFGLNGEPDVNAAWLTATIQDDPVRKSNTRGFVSFATSGPDSRTTQVFINFVDGNAKLDGMGFAPFGQVVEGMEVVDSLYKGYGEGAPRGTGPNQGTIRSRGNEYLRTSYPKLDYVTTARVLEP